MTSDKQTTSSQVDQSTKNNTTELTTNNSNIETSYLDIFSSLVAIAFTALIIIRKRKLK